MKINHNYFSELAFNLAENNLGKTKKTLQLVALLSKIIVLLAQVLHQLMVDLMLNIML